MLADPVVATVAYLMAAALGVPVSVEDADRVVRAARSGDSRRFARAMLRYRTAWRKLDPGTKARLEALVRFDQTGAYAVFVRYDSAAVLGPFAANLFTPAGTCSVLPAGAPPIGSAVTSPLDAGASLSLVGPGGPWTLKNNRTGQYQITIGPEPVAGSAAPGTYTMSGRGGRDVGAFSATLAMSAPVISGKAAFTNLDPAQPVNVTWTGGAGSPLTL
jgi:hypothetical protein